MAFGTQELLIVLLLALILFGGRKLPELARSLGLSVNEFKKTQGKTEEKPQEK